jgi:hypothetical protein
LYHPTTKWTWAFFLVIFVQAVVGLALESYIFGQFQSELVPAASEQAAADNGKWARAIPTQLALLIFGFIYQFVLTYDALSNQNTIQVIGLAVMNGGLIIYTGIQYEQVYDAFVQLLKYKFIPADYFSQVKGSLIALPVILGLFTIILAFLAWQLYKEFGWKIYKQIGADPKMKRRYLTYQVRGRSHIFISKLTQLDLHCFIEV